MKKVFSILLITTIALTLSSCSGLIRKTVLKTVDPYFHGPSIDGSQFEQLTENIYTFRWNWYRNLIIPTDEGLVIIDPMNRDMSVALKRELDQRFPNEKVNTLIYSHYHLDHTKGGDVFSPKEVIAHSKSPYYWKDFDTHEILKPTRYISGDTVLQIGGIEIRAVYLGLSHTDTLYAFHIPSARLVFAPDLGFVKAVQPVGVPDRYSPGYLRAMNKVIAIDFDTFVASHFGYGVKQDLVNWRDMLETGRSLARQAIKKYNTPGLSKHQMAKYFDEVYYPMRKQYGNWHGFNEMYIINLIRDITGESLGY